jgi:hypothetical protein
LFDSQAPVGTGQAVSMAATATVTQHWVLDPAATPDQRTAVNPWTRP